MHRTEGAGHVNNRFAKEDVAASRPPTEITDDWLNSVQEELANIATMNGGALLTPKNDTNDQCRDAIKAYINGLTGSGAGGGFSYKNTERRTITGNTTLTPADVGYWFDITVAAVGANAITVTLPRAAACPKGASISFVYRNIAPASNAHALQAAAGESIFDSASNMINNPSGGNTLIPIGPEECVTLTALADGWYVTHDGFGQRSFARTLTTNGWQRLPKGMYLQWMQGYAIASGYVNSFPIAFPNACLGVGATANQSTDTTLNVVANALSARSVTLYANGAINYPVSIFIWGH